jgi:uncharacterized protein YndB with AHSA1/START domain
MIEMLPDGLRVVRRVRTGREDAFDAWVNPARLRAWFGPVGTTLVAVDGELRVGAQYRLRIRHQDDSVDELIWSFREIVPPERLVFGWTVGSGPAAGNPETVVTVLFRDGGSFTEIQLEHTGAEADEERRMFASGWADCFAGLDALLHQSV